TLHVTRENASSRCEPTNPGAALGLDGDVAQGSVDHARPGDCDPSAPPSPDRPSVRAERALPAKLATGAARADHERLNEMRHRAPHEAEVDAIRALEADRLERGSRPALHPREVGSEHHVAASLPHVELVCHGPWRTAEVGGGDQVEDDVLRR